MVFKDICVSAWDESSLSIEGAISVFPQTNIVSKHVFNRTVIYMQLKKAICEHVRYQFVIDLT